MASSTTAAQQQQHQGLPSISSLTNGLRPAAPISPELQSGSEPIRDSGTWPQPQSKHNSASSGLQVRTLLNPDESPSRNQIPFSPLSTRVPTSASQLPSINQGFSDNNANRESYNSYNSRDSYNRDSLGRELSRDSYLESRRSSVDSRMHQGFNSLYINGPGPQSPYESANTSQVSLAASLRRPNGNPMSPHSARSSIRGGNAPPRIAPPIMPVGRGPGVPDPTAAKPTQGFAWAFPDSAIPEERRNSDSGESSVDNNVSRQNSFAASSIRSSIFSNDSQMPQGQRRFQEDDPANTTHHHSMQHRTIQSLQNDNLSAQGVGNYSRTPELRVSHKLAERKRRSEMKDLFEDLNKAVPSSGGTKASKWEILTKAIEYIRTTQHQERNLHAEIQRLQRETEYMREAHKENEELKTEVQVMYQHLRRLDPNATHMYGRLSQQLSQQQGQLPTNGNPSISLPPLNTAQGASQSGSTASFNGAQPAAMQGVEYGYGSGR